MPLLDARELDRSYDRNRILTKASMTIDLGERIGLVGNNGSGKCTLGRLWCDLGWVCVCVRV